MITSFPKIFAIGTRYIEDIFNEEVEITEKLDGSQFIFGKIDGVLYVRSKGAIIYPETCPTMFVEGLKYVQSIQDKLPEGITFYGEYLQKPKHNCLKYDNIPKNHIALFGAIDNNKRCCPMEGIKVYADFFDIDLVKEIYHGRVSHPADLIKFLERESMLGGTKLEGIVVKNYSRPFLLGGQPMPLMCGKLVSDGFKEVNNKRQKEYKKDGDIESIIAYLKTEARWEKAIQHLKEFNVLINEPKDIGTLLREINVDIESEEKDNIKEMLWKHFKKGILSGATRGFAEWYKNKLIKRSFNETLE